MSVDFKTMIESLLKQKPDVSFEQVRDLIDEKKRKIGAGYLTDQGALFLVAADLGVSLGSRNNTDVSIKNLYIGAKDVTVFGRIMSVYPPRNFIRKDTKEEVRSKTLTLYDSESTIRVRIWDDRPSVGSGDQNLNAGDLVKISRGNVKSGLDGRPVINLSSASQIELVRANDSAIPDIDSITIPVEDVRETTQTAVITGHVGNPRISQFTNSRGENTKLLQFQLFNEEQTRDIRTLIWNVDESKLPKIFEFNSKVRLIGVKVKQANPQYGSGDLEIHGDEGTVLEFFGAKMDVDIKILRVLSSGGETKGNTAFLAVDNTGKYLRLSIDSSLLNGPLDPDTMIECVPSRIFGDSIFLNRDDSYVRVIEDIDSFPKAASLETKVKEVKISDFPYILEVIVLQSPNSTDVTTKNGEVVRVSDTLIGDDTGEIRLVGWRQHSEEVRNLVVGDRVRILGASATRGVSGQTELTLRAESSLITIK